MRGPRRFANISDLAAPIRGCRIIFVCCCWAPAYISNDDDDDDDDGVHDTHGDGSAFRREILMGKRAPPETPGPARCYGIITVRGPVLAETGVIMSDAVCPFRIRPVFETLEVARAPPEPRRSTKITRVNLAAKKKINKIIYYLNRVSHRV